MNTHIQKYDPLLQKSWYLLSFAVQSPSESQKQMYIQLFWSSIDEYYNQIAQFEAFQCGAGCAHCCFDNPHGVSAIEIQRIIPRLSDEQKRRIAKYAKEWDQRKHENPQLRQQAWKKTCKPCPLLQEGHCSVYDVRPLACRSFFSIHAPEWCHPLHPNYQKQPQIGHDDIHSLLENLSKQYGWPASQDLISGLNHLIQEKHQ